MYNRMCIELSFMSNVFPLESHATDFSWLSLYQLKIMAWDPRESIFP
jgi:hypothetical protein